MVRVKAFSPLEDNFGIMMKKLIATLLTVLLGISLIGASVVFKNRHSSVLTQINNINDKCTDKSISCKIFAPLFRDVYNGAKGVERRKISKDSLPLVRIYMNDGAVKKLDDKRKWVLAKTKPILISESNDWVKATVIVEYAGKKEKSKVSLRLKGDWGDHLEDPKKLSFRIKTRAGGYLFGMKTFSIQHPRVRRYGYEAALLAQMRSHDILAPRYSFVEVQLNDFTVGVMALEEHFTKEMIEAQNRRDGPLLALNEDPLWNQWDINLNIPAIDGSLNGTMENNFSSLRDSAIKNFNKSKYIKGSIPTNNVIRGQALLRDYLDGKVSAREVFDYEKLSKYWILVNIWGGCHSAAWHNRRFYYNPMSGLLEPISFDNIPYPNRKKTCEGMDIRLAINDPQFLTQVVDSAAEIYEELQSEQYAASLKKRQEEYAVYFSYEGFSDMPEAILPATLIANLRTLLSSLTGNYDQYGNLKRTRYNRKIKFVGADFLRDQSQLGLHLTAYYYPYQDQGGDFEFRNLTLDDITVTSIHVGKKKKRTTINMPEFILKSGDKSPGVITKPLGVSDEILRKYQNFTIEYIFQEKAYSRPLFVQFKNSPSGFEKDPIAVVGEIIGNKNVDVKNQQVTFASGVYDFTQSIALPKGWSVVINAGSVLNFKDGTLLKIQGPLFVKGTKLKPVIMTVNTNSHYRHMGAWGGILVSKSHERSKVKYLRLKGTGTQNLANRQGFYGMTGCLSFYESDVDISYSSFMDAQCEDALNIVKADFILDNVLISNARADAFDSDFSTGLIKNSSFVSSGNDGIDISGTHLKLDTVKMTDIGDKAISVGEKSTLEAQSIEINGAVLGVVSKDLSTAQVTNVKFSGISGTALMTYIKKQEYGPSSIECINCDFIDVMMKTGIQDGTKIHVNGQNAQRKNFSQQQMVDAGLN